MKQGLAQQVLAGVAILLVVAVTLVSGLLLASADGPLSASARRTPTATPYRLPTLPPGTEVASANITPDTDVPPTVTLAPTDEPALTGEPASAATVAPADTPIPTSTPMPTVTRQPTGTPVPDPTSPPSPTPCQVRAGWVPYTVQPGETLFRIGLRYGVSTSTMQRANCLASTSLDAGQVIYVPPTQPQQPAATATPAPAVGGPIIRPTSSGGAGACSDTGSTITSPTVGGVLSGETAFYGSAVHPDLQFYKLELRQEGASGTGDFVTAHTGSGEVRGGLLGTINTAAFPNGEYWVRLVVVDNTGNYPERCSRLYTFRN